MQVVIRADASRAIGTGHVMRCLTLATALRERGAEVTFISRMHEAHLGALIGGQGFGLRRLPPRAGSGGPDSPTDGWLGATWDADAEETIDALRRSGDVAWLVVDHYTIDHRWEERVRPFAQRLFVIDDLANRAHDCDLLLDQNLVASMGTRYDGLVSRSCALMLGPAYAMLQPDFREMRREVRARSGSIRSILISFGGADADNLTGRALAAFLGLHRADVHVDVVVGTANPWGPSLREQSAGCSNVTIHTALPTLAPLMSKVDLAIGAAGSTTWERLCLGLPALVVTQADNQRPIAEAISDHRLARWLGDASTVTEEDFAAAMRELLEQDLAPDWSRRCLAVVDGRGVDRVAAALLLTRETALRVRPVTESDEALLLEWANDRLTRQNAFSSAPISASEHQEWFRRRLGDSDGCRIYIAETLDGVPVGQVRFDHRLADWRISYALAPQFRGQRLGRRLLDLGIRELAQAEEGATLVAEVKGSNEASRRVFDSLGFTSTRIDEDVIVYRRSASPT